MLNTVQYIEYVLKKNVKFLYDLLMSYVLKRILSSTNLVLFIIWHGS